MKILRIAANCLASVAIIGLLQCALSLQALLSYPILLVKGVYIESSTNKWDFSSDLFFQVSLAFSASTYMLFLAYIEAGICTE